MILRGSKAWVHYLDKVEFPLLSQSLHQICEMTDKSDASISQLASVLMKDANISSSVLRLANSAFYNPTSIAVSTLSRAIVQIGFDAIKSIAICSLVVDSLHSDHHKQALFCCLARSFRSAVLAKSLAKKFPLQQQEAIFVAALLYHIGEAAFWASGHPQSDEMGKILQNAYIHISQEHHVERSTIQRDVLGTQFKSISRGLVKRWNMGGLLEECLETPRSLSARIVQSAISISSLSEPELQNSDLSRSKVILINELSGLLKQPSKEIRTTLECSQKIADTLIKKLGLSVSELSNSTPLRKKREANGLLELQALQKMVSIARDDKLSDSEQLGQLITHCLNGLYEGAGLDRVALFLNKSSVCASSLSFQLCKSVGDILWPETLSHYKQLVVDSKHPIFNALHESNVTQIVPIKEKHSTINGKDLQRYPFDDIIPCLIVPVTLSGSCRGFLYADALGTNDFSSAQMASMQLFCQQLISHQLKHQRSALHKLSDTNQIKQFSA